MKSAVIPCGEVATRGDAFIMTGDELAAWRGSMKSVAMHYGEFATRGDAFIRTGWPIGCLARLDEKHTRELR